MPTWPTMAANTTTETTDHLTPREIYAKNVRLGRKLADRMTQDKLAELIGVRDYNEISRYEHARRLPSIERQDEIATKLGQSLPWFWARHDDAWKRIDEDKP